MTVKLIVASALSGLLLTYCTGCASTTLYARGKPILRTQADATNISYSGYGVTFHADRLVHSTPTLAGGKAANNVLGGVATLGTAIGSAVAVSGIVK